MGIDGIPASLMINTRNKSLAHCYATLEEIDVYVREERIEKALLSLGLIQGCLWAQQVYTIAEIAEHNRIFL